MFLITICIFSHLIVIYLYYHLDYHLYSVFCTRVSWYLKWLNLSGTFVYYYRAERQAVWLWLCVLCVSYVALAVWFSGKETQINVSFSRISIKCVKKREKKEKKENINLLLSIKVYHDMIRRRFDSRAIFCKRCHAYLAFVSCYIRITFLIYRKRWQ